LYFDVIQLVYYGLCCLFFWWDIQEIIAKSTSSSSFRVLGNMFMLSLNFQ
jgi:hypothetical protein